MPSRDELDQLCVNTIRMLAVDCVQKAKSGHPGTPMGAADMVYVLWDRFLKHNPSKSQVGRSRPLYTLPWTRLCPSLQPPTSLRVRSFVR